MHTDERDANLDSLPAADGNGCIPPAHRIVHAGSGTVVVEIIGEHDLASYDTIRALFLKLIEANTLLVVDVSEATFIDSSFLRALVIANKHAVELGSHLRLRVGTATIVRQVLEISGLSEYLDCTHDLDEACGSWKRVGRLA